MSEMLPRLTWQLNILHLRNPFRLSYGVSETRHAFWIRLADDAGWGEAAIPPYYGIDDASMIAMWEAAARRTESFPRRSGADRGVGRQLRSRTGALRA